MISTSTGIGRQELFVLLVGLAGLVAILLVYNKPPFYDEDDYLKNVVLLQQYGFSKTYLLKHIGSAGPLFSAVHYVLAPLTKLETPAIRLVSLFLLLGTFWFAAQTLKMLQFSKSYAWLGMAIPMTYVISGLALTEIPAIFFLAGAIYMITRTLTAGYSFMKSAFWLVLAGVFLSLAILGRQPYLLILGALPTLFFRKDNYVRNSGLLLITLLFALALPGYVFFTWNGLVAPYDETVYYSHLAKEGVSVRLEFFFLCTAYYAVIFIIVTPQFYLRPTAKETVLMMAFTLLTIILNYQYGFFQFLPMQQLIEQTFSPAVAKWGKTICGAGLLMVGSYFVLTLARQLIKRNYPTPLLFFSAALLLIAVACIKITWGFSSRYPAQALPFLIPAFAYFYKPSKYGMLRLSIGVVLGLISFASYMVSS